MGVVRRVSRWLLIGALAAAVALSGCRGGAPRSGAPPAGPAAGGGSPGPAPVPGPSLQPGEAVHPLTGLPVPEQALSRRVLLVSVDNNPRARPQYGLAAADLVYELPVEGGITRFVALYLAGEAEQVGPVRSARHDMLDLVLEWDAVWVHAGESPQHRERRAVLKPDELDDLQGAHGGGVFWRGKDRRPPHNLYTSTARLRAKLQALGWERQPPARAPFRFAADGEPEGAPALEAVIAVPGALHEVITYIYDPRESVYRRYVRGRPHRDGRTGMVLSATNVVLQFTRAEPIPGDREGRLNVSLVGEGRLQVFSGGRVREGRWRKARPEAPTEFREADGTALALRPGQTWILILPEGARVEVRGD